MGYQSQKKYLRTYRLSVDGGGTASTTFPGIAHFCLIQNLSNNLAQITLDDDAQTTFLLDGQSSVNLNNGDVHVKKVTVTNVSSGEMNTLVQVLAGFI